MKIVQENHVIGYWKGKVGRERKFVQLTNFGLKLLKHIRAPRDLPQLSGFIAEVSHKQRSKTSPDGTVVKKG